MPWKTSSLLEARQRFVDSVLRRFKPVAQLCRETGISRKTGFKWLSRFRAAGGPGLRNQSRRPRHSPGQTAGRWLCAIQALRNQHPNWGSRKLYAHLRRRHPRAHLPRPRTITGWLHRWGCVRPRRRKARPGPTRVRPALTEPRRPNEVWTVDFKGWFRTGDGRRVNPLTVRDLFSRFILGVHLLPIQHQPVCLCFQRLFRRYGQPKVIRVDHGAPFAGIGPLELSRLSAWWLRLGIVVEFTRRACPQDNGAHEQMHRIYKADTASPAAATPQAQQRRSTLWRHFYNHHRPHEALGQEVPAQWYRKSRRRYPGPLPPLRYPRHWQTRRVSSRGRVHWKGRARMIGRAFTGEYIGLRNVRSGVQEVYFERVLIGLLLDQDPGGIRPVRWAKRKSHKAHP